MKETMLEVLGEHQPPPDNLSKCRTYSCYTGLGLTQLAPTSNSANRVRTGASHICQTLHTIEKCGSEEVQKNLESEDSNLIQQARLQPESEITVHF